MPRVALDLAPYAAVANRSFRQYATYRGATVAGVATNTVFGFIYASVFTAVHDTAEEVQGFTATDTAVYVFAAQGFLMMTGAFGDREISERIRSGDIAADLYRPVDFQLWWLANDAGKAAFYALGRGLPPFVAGILVLRLPLPTSWLAWLGFAVATVLGVTIAFAIRFLVNLAGFWLIDAKGLVALVALTQSFFAGHFAPLYFFPDWLEQPVRLLPFAGITAQPIELLLGKHPGVDALWVYAHQIIWLVILLALGRVVLDRARNKLVIQGG